MSHCCYKILKRYDLLNHLTGPAADAEVTEDDSGSPIDDAAKIAEERRERLVPELERLHISCPASFSAETLMNMVRSRTAPQRRTPPTYEDAARTANDDGETAASKASEPASPLRYINIHCTDPALRVEPQVIARLRIMAAAGIKLFFRVGDRDVDYGDQGVVVICSPGQAGCNRGDIDNNDYTVV